MTFGGTKRWHARRRTPEGDESIGTAHESWRHVVGEVLVHLRRCMRNASSVRRHPRCHAAFVRAATSQAIGGGPRASAAVRGASRQHPTAGDTVAIAWTIAASCDGSSTGRSTSSCASRPCASWSTRAGAPSACSARSSLAPTTPTGGRTNANASATSDQIQSVNVRRRTSGRPVYVRGRPCATLRVLGGSPRVSSAEVCPSSACARCVRASSRCRTG